MERVPEGVARFHPRPEHEDNFYRVTRFKDQNDKVGVLGTLERKVRLSVCHDRILAAAARKPPLRSSTRQTIAFPEQDELTLAGYRSSMILPTSENGAIAR